MSDSPGDEYGDTRATIRRIGFDFRRGRLDLTAHPFCCTPGPHDCRITARYKVHSCNEAFFSILHEAGHFGL